MQQVTIIGCGDIGRRVGKELILTGHSVQALTRTEEHAEELKQEGFTAVIGNLDYQEDTPAIDVHGHQVFFLAPPQGGGLSDCRVLNFCRRLAADNCPEKLVYISTSGVYGDCGGALVTEDTPINPQTSRAKRRVSAETQFREQADLLGYELVVLRVTGIYGPGRLPVARVQQGHPVLNSDQASFTNRIHSLDLVRICLVAMERGEDGDIYNVCDGEQSTMTEYFTAIADLYGLPRPKQISMAEAEQVMNPLMLSYLKESRRMSNEKLKVKLGVELLYPTLIEGLKACQEEL